MSELFKTMPGRRASGKASPTGANSLFRIWEALQVNSVQALKEFTGREPCIHDQFNFLKSNIRRKGISKSLGFKSIKRGSSASTGSVHDMSRDSTEFMEMSISSGTRQPLIVSIAGVVVFRSSSANQEVLHQFLQMKTMLTIWVQYMRPAEQHFETTWPQKQRTSNKVNFRLSEMILLNYLLGSRTRQRRGPASKVHFQVIQHQFNTCSTDSRRSEIETASGSDIHGVHTDNP